MSVVTLNSKERFVSSAPGGFTSNNLQRPYQFNVPMTQAITISPDSEVALVSFKGFKDTRVFDVVAGVNDILYFRISGSRDPNSLIDLNLNPVVPVTIAVGRYSPASFSATLRDALNDANFQNAWVWHVSEHEETKGDSNEVKLKIRYEKSAASDRRTGGNWSLAGLTAGVGIIEVSRSGGKEKILAEATPYSSGTAVGPGLNSNFDLLMGVDFYKGALAGGTGQYGRWDVVNSLPLIDPIKQKLYYEIFIEGDLTDGAILGETKISITNPGTELADGSGAGTANTINLMGSVQADLQNPPGIDPYWYNQTGQYRITFSDNAALSRVENAGEAQLVNAFVRPCSFDNGIANPSMISAFGSERGDSDSTPIADWVNTAPLYDAPWVLNISNTGGAGFSEVKTWGIRAYGFQDQEGHNNPEKLYRKEQYSVGSALMPADYYAGGQDLAYSRVSYPRQKGGEQTFTKQIKEYGETFTGFFMWVGKNNATTDFGGSLDPDTIGVWNDWESGFVGNTIFTPGTTADNPSVSMKSRFGFYVAHGGELIGPNGYVASYLQVLPCWWGAPFENEPAATPEIFFGFLNQMPLGIEPGRFDIAHDGGPEPQGDLWGHPFYNATDVNLSNLQDEIKMVQDDTNVSLYFKHNPQEVGSEWKLIHDFRSETSIVGSSTNEKFAFGAGNLVPNSMPIIPLINPGVKMEVATDGQYFIGKAAELSNSTSISGVTTTMETTESDEVFMVVGDNTITPTDAGLSVIGNLGVNLGMYNDTADPTASVVPELNVDSSNWTTDACVPPCLKDAHWKSFNDADKTNDEGSVFVRIPELSGLKSYGRLNGVSQAYQDTQVGPPIPFVPTADDESEIYKEFNTPIYQKLYNTDEQQLHQLSVNLVDIFGNPLTNMVKETEVCLHFK